MIRHLPNTLTIANLLCGCVGIMLLFEGNTIGASWLIVLAALFDFLDGFAAKLLNAQSAIGKDLDSLADVVSFGVLPSFILLVLMKNELEPGLAVLSYSSLLIAAFSALRLAKFNNDHRQGDQFIGVPTPANALLVASFPFILDAHTLAGVGWLLVLYAIGMSYLLVSEIKLLALKFKGFGWAANQPRYLLVIACFCLIAVFGWGGVPLSMLTYLGLSVFYRAHS